MFHASPVQFDIDACLARCPTELSWAVTRYESRILPDDPVFLWRSGRDAGVVGEAIVVARPTSLRQPDACECDWKGYRPSCSWVRLTVLSIDSTLFVPRSWLKHDPLFRGGELIEAGQPTNFPLSHEQLTRVATLRRIGDRDLAANDLVAALWAYAECAGVHPTTSHPAVIAASLRTGRPVPTIWELAARFGAIDPRQGNRAGANQPAALKDVWDRFWDRSTGQLSLELVKSAILEGPDCSARRGPLESVRAAPRDPSRE